MSIPPVGWGAVEMMIWDYYNILSEMGYTVEIINTPDRSEILSSVNSGSYDVVHLHYDVFSDIMPLIKTKLKIISSHYPYISVPEKYSSDGYDKQINNIVKNHDFYIFASSVNDIETFIKYGAEREKTFLSPLGVNTGSYFYVDSPIYDRTLCFSQIVERKRQYVIQDLPTIDFFGRMDDKNFKNLSNYKGEADRKFLNEEITKYSNFILLSSVENATPLAVKEALICGLGVVVSEAVSIELDRDLDFITIIPENMIHDMNYLADKIEQNKKISALKRKDIRKYGIEKFGMRSIVEDFYIKKINNILDITKI
jgi:hypothetical protein